MNRFSSLYGSAFIVFLITVTAAYGFTPSFTQTSCQVAKEPTAQSSFSVGSLYNGGSNLASRYWPFALAGAGVYIFTQDHEVREEILEHNAPHGEQSEFYNHFEPFGTAQPYFYIVPAFLAHGLLFKENKSILVGSEIAAGIATTAVFTTYFKELFGRQRPWQTSEPEDFFHGGNAFYSGHTATAFTFATILAKNYPRQRLEFLGIHHDLPIVPLLSYSLAATVGLQRIYSNRHWTSDVFVGAIAGYFFGSLTVKVGNHINSHFNFIPGSTPQVGMSFYLN